MENSQTNLVLPIYQNISDEEKAAEFVKFKETK
jgi:hypothetical protein